MGWREIVGDDGEIVSIEHFGASADGAILFEQFGFTPDRVVAAAHATLERVGAISAPDRQLIRPTSCPQPTAI